MDRCQRSDGASALQASFGMSSRGLSAGRGDRVSTEKGYKAEKKHKKEAKETKAAKGSHGKTKKLKKEKKRAAPSSSPEPVKPLKGRKRPPSSSDSDGQPPASHKPRQLIINLPPGYKL